jgi:hypothetical protein|tara:strand:- start:128 stop:478 length:351 start_codon:yes stop_codon:yes gene_type:complete
VADIYGKGAKGKATRLHAQIIRALGFCQSCGSSHSLQCAHIVSRKYARTRTSLDNAFCLCASCHRRFTDNPVEFGKFTLEQLGVTAYDALIVERNRIDKMDWEEEVVRLSEIWKGM